MEMMLNRYEEIEKENGKCRKSLCWEDPLTMPCFLPLLSRPDKLCATTSNQGGFQRQAPLFGMLALIFLCKGGKLCSVWNLSSLQCVFPAGWCIVLHRRQAPKSAGLLLLCQQLRKLYSLQHLHENSSHILPRLVPEQIPFKHSCEGPDDMPAHAKVKIVRALISYPPFSSPGLPSWFQSHPSHLRRPSDPRDLAGAAPPIPKIPGGVALRAQGPCGSKEGPGHRQWSYQGSNQVLPCLHRHLDSLPSILH